MNLVLFKVNHLGDNVVFLPVVQALQRALPDARLRLISTPAESALYRGVLADDAILAPADRSVFNHAHRKHPLGLARWIAQLAAMRADASLISYDQGNLAHLLARWLGGRIRVGANLRYIRVRGSLTHVVPPPPDWNVVRWNWSMGEALARALDPHVAWPAEPPAPNLSHLVGPVPTRDGPIVIHAGTKMAIRQWPLDRFAALAATLARAHPVVWIDRPETCDAPVPAGVERISPASIPELVRLLAGARLYVGNNSGPMHVANALGTPGVIISGPSAYGWDPYWYRERWTVLRHPSLACLPCERPDVGVETCAHRTEPLACLRYWSVDAVAAACQERLEAARTH